MPLQLPLIDSQRPKRRSAIVSHGGLSKGLGRGCLAVAMNQTEATASKCAKETLRNPTGPLGSAGVRPEPGRLQWRHLCQVGRRISFSLPATPAHHRCEPALCFQRDETRFEEEVRAVALIPDFDVCVIHARSSRHLLPKFPASRATASAVPAPCPKYRLRSALRRGRTRKPAFF